MSMKISISYIGLRGKCSVKKYFSKQLLNSYWWWILEDGAKNLVVFLLMYKIV